MRKDQKNFRETFPDARFVELTTKTEGQMFFLELWPGQINLVSDGTRRPVRYPSLEALREQYGDCPVVTVTGWRHGLAALRGWADDGWHQEYTQGQLARPYNQK